MVIVRYGLPNYTIFGLKMSRAFSFDAILANPKEMLRIPFTTENYAAELPFAADWTSQVGALQDPSYPVLVNVEDST